jgi:hypothetical protein
METINLINRIACLIGLHAGIRRDKWTPSIGAEIVTDFEQTHTCLHCRKVLHHLHLRWDGKEMINVKNHRGAKGKPKKQ